MRAVRRGWWVESQESRSLPSADCSAGAKTRRLVEIAAQLGERTLEDFGRDPRRIGGGGHGSVHVQFARVQPSRGRGERLEIPYGIRRELASGVISVAGHHDGLFTQEVQDALGGVGPVERKTVAEIRRRRVLE